MTHTFFVLRTHRYSEADLFINGLDKNGAKIKMVARSALKSKRRFPGGVFEPTHLVEAKLSDTERDGVRTVLEARVVESFDLIRQDYAKLECALRMIGVVDSWSLEGVTDHRPLYDLLGHSLQQVTQVEDVERLYLHFVVRLCHFMGVLPEDRVFEPMVEVPMALHAELGEFDSQRIVSRLGGLDLPGKVF